MQTSRLQFRLSIVLLSLAAVGLSFFVGERKVVQRSEAQEKTLASPSAAFTPGNIVVYRVGDGVASLNSNATTVFLDEFTPAGALVQSIAMPITVNGSNKRLTASGTATTEGYLSLSENGQYLLVPGYDAVVGTGGITGTNWSATNRVIGRVDALGNVDTTTALGDSVAGQNPRGAASTNGTDLWITSAAAGVRYATFGGVTSVSVSNSPSSLRATRVVGGQLYVSSASAGINLATVGSGTPTTSGQTITNLPGFPTANSPYQFYFADLNAGVAGNDTVYVADDGGQVQKFSLVAGNWTANGAVAVQFARGLAGITSGSAVTLYVSSGTSPTRILTLTDTAGYNATINGTASVIATSAANTAFRGVSMTPGTGAANTAPVINSSPSTTATEDTLYTYNATRTDADGPGQTWSLLGTHTCGGSIVAGTGVFTFTPLGPVPPASCVLAIQVCDGGSPNLCAQQSTTVNIAAVNDPPAITSSAPTTATEDLLYTYNATFTDPDGTGSTWELVAPTHTCGGSINGSGVFTFTPAGPVPAAGCVVAVRVCDNSPSCSPTQSTTVNITAVNDPPVAVDDNLSTTMNVALVVNGSVLLSNDLDPELQPLTVTAVANAVNGSVVLNAGVVTFTPNPGFTGPASFDYTVSDGSLTDTGVVNVTVNAPAFNGAVSVGAGQTYTSLTNNGGLFQAMNAATISGNVVVNLTSDMTAETGTHALNQQAETGVGGYTIFFQASGGQRLIEGSNATALITLNGADRVTFSGLAFGPFGIRFRNTGNGATIRLINDASNNSILNCTVEGGTTSNVSAVVLIGAGPTTGNDNNSVSDSTIRDRTDAPAVPVNLFLNDGSGGANNSGTIIANNQFINFTQTGIFNAVADNTTISGNTISQTATRSTGLFSIQMLLNLGANVVSGNTIRDHTTTSSFVGINLQGNPGSVAVSANRISNIDNSTGSPNPFAGVQMIGSDAGSAITLTNNMISLVPGTASAQFVFGVHDTRSAGSLTMNYNSVLVGGPGGATSTWAFRRGTASTSSISLTGNILFNDRTGGADNFAVGDGSSGAGSWSSNFNIFAGTGSTQANYFELGGVGVPLAAWQAGPPARDANSLASVAGAGPLNVGNLFASPNDLHLRTIGNNPAINAGVEVGVSTDFDGQARPFNGIPDIGADEVQTTPTAGDASIGGRVVTTNGRGIRNVRVLVTGGTLLWPRAAVTNAFGYFTFDGLRAGETYVVSVSGKRFVFETPVRVVSLGDSVSDVDFVGLVIQ